MYRNINTERVPLIAGSPEGNYIYQRVDNIKPEIIFFFLKKKCFISYSYRKMWILRSIGKLLMKSDQNICILGIALLK